MWECYLCGGEVIWQADFDYGDFGYEGEGIVHTFHCRDCGAEITVFEDFESEVEE